MQRTAPPSLKFFTVSQAPTYEATRVEARTAGRRSRSNLEAARFSRGGGSEWIAPERCAERGVDRKIDVEAWLGLIEADARHLEHELARVIAEPIEESDIGDARRIGEVVARVLAEMLGRGPTCPSEPRSEKPGRQMRTE